MTSEAGGVGFDPRPLPAKMGSFVGDVNRCWNLGVKEALGQKLSLQFTEQMQPLGVGVGVGEIENPEPGSWYQSWP